MAHFSLKSSVLTLSILALAALSLWFITGCNGEARANKTTYENIVLGSDKSKLSMTPPTTKQLVDGPSLSQAPNVKPLVKAKEHNVRIDCTHSMIEVEDGVSYAAWTFGGTLPGPVLRVKQGDLVHFTMTNRSDKTMNISPPSPHSIDFHAAMVNPHDKYQEVVPGATIQFDWTANYPGVFMYHCGSPAILQHMIYGMVGMTIVEPKDGYPTEVDKEFALVQSEHYLTKLDDGTWVTDMSAALDKNATYVTFNGKPAQYVHNPLKVKAGERVRLFICNVGPCGTSSFHVVGTIFDRVWFDGNPDNEMRGMQTVLLGSSSGAIVEFVLPEEGTYPFVDHEFADVEKGAVGLFVAEGTLLASK